jgi:hypothetical protein
MKTETSPKQSAMAADWSRHLIGWVVSTVVAFCAAVKDLPTEF